MRKVCLEAAIHEHDEPFYGKTPGLRTYAYRGRAKQGATRFFRIFSAYVIYLQLRLPLAMTFMLPEDETVDVVRRLYQRLQALKLHIGALYLDCGYCYSGVITSEPDVHAGGKQAANPVIDLGALRVIWGIGYPLQRATPAARRPAVRSRECAAPAPSPIDADATGC